MVYRIYVEKKQEFAEEARAALREIQSFLKIDGISGLRIVNRYDVEGIDREVFEKSRELIFLSPVIDDLLDEIPKSDFMFAVESVPGQFDQKAASAAQCIALISKQERPLVKSARVFCLTGSISDKEIDIIKKYFINAVECRETQLDPYETLVTHYEEPGAVAVLNGFIALDRNGLIEFLDDYSLAMDIDDLTATQDYFKKINRDPTLTEIRVLDTYWSDHCRHTTFMTRLTDLQFEDENVKKSFDRYLSVKKELGREEKPVTLMDVATAGMRYLKETGKLDRLDESDEINACTVKTKIKVDGVEEDWLFLFKNETHNHPTEIEPFGGAATCVGGAIRDPLSGRAFVYQAMRITGAADPTVPYEKTLQGKLSQRRITTLASSGYSSYANQIGLASGYLNEIYHPGFAAKRMELGAVVGAAPARNVVREQPVDGDVVILLGGKTGRDGIGGATGSSKTQNVDSLANLGAEVQKGDAPEEHKIVRLFRQEAATRLIKRCNDFGAGGVSVAIGELADGLSIDLDVVPPKYPGMDGTELAISESQERMAVVVANSDAKLFIEMAEKENLEATIVARVTAEPKLVMHWKGQTIVDIDRDFLNTNGAPKYMKATVAKQASYEEKKTSFKDGLNEMAKDINFASKRGIGERFCATVGAATVLMPYGGKYQRTPAQCMAAKFPVLSGETDAASVMAYGYNPFVSEKSPYRGAYLAVVESLSKLAAAGALGEETYLSFQEYFERLRDEAVRWGKPLAALLGALDAQLDYGFASIGGKDSMSGSFEGIDVPPTLVSFAVSIVDANGIMTQEFKSAGHTVSLLAPEYDNATMRPKKDSQLAVWKMLKDAIAAKKVKAAYAIGAGGIAEAVYNMSLGNRIGVSLKDSVEESSLFSHCYGGFVIELEEGAVLGTPIGTTVDTFALSYKNDTVDLLELQRINEQVLAGVFPVEVPTNRMITPTFTVENREAAKARISSPKPLAMIPVFPGTNGEFDMMRAAEKAGISTETFVVRDRLSGDVAESVDAFCKVLERSKILLLSGGFSTGDEPGGAAKYIAAYLRQPKVRECLETLISNDGLILGIGNGFQALVKLGLLPFGEIRDENRDFVALATNRIGRHQSKMVNVRIASNNSPWLSGFSVGEIDTVPFSAGEGRLTASNATIETLVANGQVASQYVDLSGNPSMDAAFNPAGAEMAIEGLLSFDGRIFGRMGHSERKGNGLFRNIEIGSNKSIFDGALAYYK